MMVIYQQLMIWEVLIFDIKQWYRSLNYLNENFCDKLRLNKFKMSMVVEVCRIWFKEVVKMVYF